MEVTLPNNKLLFSPREIKDLGICSATKFYELVRDGELIAHKFGRYTKVTRENLMAYLSSRPLLQTGRPSPAIERSASNNATPRAAA